jgi:PAS domain S-box-containing protein
MDLPADQYRLLVEASRLMIWRSGVGASSDYFNPAWLAFTGRTPAELVGNGWLDGVHPDDRERVAASAREHFARRAPFELEYRLRRADGAYRWVLDQGAPYHDAAGRFAGYIGVCVDVHPRRTAEDAKATFLAVLGHELRTPLQALVLYAEVVRSSAEHGEPLPPGLGERLHRQVSRLRQVVSSTALAPGGAPPHVQSVATDLVHLLQLAVDVRQDTAGAASVRLEVAGEPRTVDVDPDALGQAMDILLDNAVKYGPPDGVVTVVLTFEPAQVRLEVLDEGAGLGDADPQLLGTPFYRGENAARGETPGLGLGLAIARRVAEAHGGTLTLGARDGRGTRATLLLPTPPRAA